MRYRAAFLAPALLVLAVAVAPLLSGARTLVLRDVLNTHLGLRASLGEAIRAGEIPILDPLRSGGQPLAGNPNALPFYPDNLLLLLGSTLWQLNAHFALHWLAAFAAAFWLGRAWGLGREGAAGAAAAYAFSGYLLSQLNLFNAVAEAALAPALWAALLETGEERTRGRGLLVAGLAWALGILGGDPLLAGLALAGGLAIAAGRHGRRLPWGRLALALLLGTAVAAPQIVETARIWGESYRGFHGYGGAIDGVRDPRALVDLLVPLFFGRPDLNDLWGESLFGGFPPLYFSLFPGLVAGALALVGGRPRRRDAIVLAVVAAAGAVVTFTGGTRLGAVLGGLPGGFFRFPEKLFLWSALGLAVAAGAGVERVVRGEGARALARAAGLLSLPMLAIWLGLGVGERARAPMQALFGPALDAERFATDRLRWAGTAMLVLATLVAALGLAAAARRRPVVVAALLVVVHAGSQWFFLRPLIPTDEAARYLETPRLAASVPGDAVLVHGGVTDTFGQVSSHVGPGELPGPEYFWLERRAHDELYAFAGMLEGRRYELAPSPEGLDHFTEHALTVGMRGFDDRRRLAVLRAIGVDRLLLPRGLDGSGAAARLDASVPVFGREVRVYEIVDPLPEASVVGEVAWAPHMNAALGEVWRTDFDPARRAVLAGAGEPLLGAPGRVLAFEAARERVAVEIDSPAGGALVLRRAFLPVWRVEIDGAPARPVIANLTRLSVPVPAGRHRVVFSVSRAPLRLALGASLLGLLGLAGLARVAGRGARSGPSPLLASRRKVPSQA